MTLLGRIIPAHAGFTLTLVRGSGLVRDHPRTRGVYLTSLTLGELDYGSSPHTRGLPSDAPKTLSKAGIIPAHAGFTTEDYAQPYAEEDHPRTRGVYRPHGFPWGRPGGSSPHTRGLRVM